ncbi:hypothetical protein ACIFQM_11225 [Paenibacillus sp. NRS-1782]|uniref:hypothetical protein n=1 Tax=unclassified Paenibacillus TaxID=185978 RepID=UPI003D2C3727
MVATVTLTNGECVHFNGETAQALRDFVRTERTPTLGWVGPALCGSSINMKYAVCIMFAEEA